MSGESRRLSAAQGGCFDEGFCPPAGRWCGATMPCCRSGSGRARYRSMAGWRASAAPRRQEASRWLSICFSDVSFIFGASLTTGCSRRAAGKAWWPVPPEQAFVNRSAHGGATPGAASVLAVAIQPFSATGSAPGGQGRAGGSAECRRPLPPPPCRRRKAHQADVEAGVCWRW